MVGLAPITLTLAGTLGDWGWNGVVPLATAALGWCPAYTLLGIKTFPTKDLPRTYRQIPVKRPDGVLAAGAPQRMRPGSSNSK
jgi:hypothetical protein